MVWFEVDISSKYQRNCQPLHHWIPIARKDTFDEARNWYQRKTCLRDAESCLTCFQYCTDNSRVKTTDSIDYLYVTSNIGNLNDVSVDLRQSLRSIIVPMNNLHPDGKNYCQVFQIKMTESIATKTLNNTKLYNKDAQMIQSNDNVLGTDKIYLLVNDVLRTVAMSYDFSNCSKLIPNSETRSSCGNWGTNYHRDRGYFCRSTASSGIDAIPYEGLILATTANAILGLTADKLILNEYKGAKYDEKLVIFSSARKQVLKESANPTK